MRTVTLAISAIVLGAIALVKEANASVASSGIPLIGKTKLDSFYLRYKNTIDSECKRLEIPISTAVATLSVESSGKPFGSDGKLLINFEPKVFKKVMAKDGYSVDETFYGGTQYLEYKSFDIARSLNEFNAFWSISMGMAQIMGFNYKTMGYNSPMEMYNDFQSSEDAQIRSFFIFCEYNKGGVLLNAIKSSDYDTFAHYYNGPENIGYGNKILSAKQKFQKETGIE